MSAFTQDFIIQPAGRKKHKTGAMDVPARLWNPDGTPFTAFGGVKKGTAVADVAAADVAVSAGAAPTKAEFDTVVAELNETKRQLNTLIGSLRTAGVIG